MLKLKYIIVDKIPPAELRYLRQNLEGNLQLELVELDKEKMEYREEALLSFPAENSIFLSMDGTMLQCMKERGMTAVGFTEPGGEMKPEFSAADMLVEGFAEIDGEFLTQVYQRNHHLPWTILETERCIVREITLEDVDDLFTLYSWEGMTEYLEPLYDYEKEKEYQKAYIENMYGFYGYGMWLVIEKETGTLIGRAGIEHREELEGELELGYAIGTPYQRQGYATEVCLAIMEYAKNYLECDRLNCLIDEGNRVSQHLAERLGFVLWEEPVINGRRMKRYIRRLD